MKKGINPPKWASRLLTWFCSEALLEEIAGDLAEAWHHRRQLHGKLRADLWYISDVIKFFKPYSFEKYSRSKQYIPMFKNYLLVALRNMLKRKAFVAVNLFGLTAGISAVMLLGTYLFSEYTYDHSFPDTDQVFRLTNQYRDQDYSCMKFDNYYSSDYEVQMKLVNHLTNYENVEEACHFVPNMSAIGPNEKQFVNLNEREFIMDDFLYTNTGMAFQALFPQQFLLGQPEDAFAQYQSAVITESKAALLFGADWQQQSILGTAIEVSNETFVLKGVVADMPGNVHFDFGMILCQQLIPSWGAYTYVKNTKNTTSDQVVAQLMGDIELVFPGYTEDVLSKGIYAVPLTDIHFTEGKLYELKPTAKSSYLLTFGMIALVILLIIWINYANLSIANYTSRQKELGVRKVMGARTTDIKYQVLTESLLLTLLAYPIIWLTIRLTIPLANGLLHSTIATDITYQPSFLLVLGGVLLLTGVLNGFYPAVVLAGSSIARLFKGQLHRPGRQKIFQPRRVLLTTQFFILTGLTSLAILIALQMKHVQQKAPGYLTEGIVYFGVNGAEKFGRLKQQLEAMPEIQAIGRGMIPGQEMYNQTTYQLQGTDVVFADGTSVYTSLGSMDVYGISSPVLTQLREGVKNAFILNRTAAEKLATTAGVEPEALVGQTLILEPESDNGEGGLGWSHTIAGIIDDFDYFTLKYESTPLFIEVFNNPRDWTYNMLIRAKTDNWTTTISAIEAAYAAVEEERPFDFTFLEDHLSTLYEQEEDAAMLTNLLTGICVILSIMGLIGVVGFIIYLRQKEIGIRKVYGASVTDILALVSKEYTIMILIATIVAIPVFYYLAELWLNNFAYRITPSIFIVVTAGILCLFTVIPLVILQSYQSARMNPADTLRSE